MMFDCFFSKKSRLKKSKVQSVEVPDNYYATHLPLKLYQYLINCGVIDLNDPNKTENEGTTFPINGKSGNAFVRVTVEKGAKKFGMVSVRVYIQNPPTHVPNRFNFTDGKWYRSEYKNSNRFDVSKGRADTGANDIYDNKKADERTDKEVEFLLKFLKQHNVTPENKPVLKTSFIPI